MAKMEKKTTQEVSNAQLLEMIQGLQNQNQELSKKLEAQTANKFADAKKRYDGPLHYSYQLWDGKPVLNYVSKKKIPNKGWSYKENGETVNNQILELTLVGGEKVDVDINEFNMYKEFSDKMEATKIVAGKEVSYKFTTEEFGEFEVQEKVIN